MRKFSLLLVSIFALITGTVFAQTGELRGTITDATTKEPVPFAAVVVLSEGNQVGGGKTDFDGNYSIKPITPGKYDVKISSVGYNTSVTKGVIIIANTGTPLNKSIESTTTEIKEIVVNYTRPVFQQDQTSTGGTLTAEELKALPMRDVNSAASTSAGVYQSNKSGEEGGLNIKGGRSTSTIYFVDGVKVRGSANVPRNSIEQVSVLTGGVPAEFGDLTGGAVNITTKGPSRHFNGGAELVTSELIGKDGYNLAAGNITGPVLVKDKGKSTERSLVGFTIAGEYLYNADPNLPATPIYKVKDDKLKELQTNPLHVSPTDASKLILDNASYITAKDLQQIDRRQDVEAQSTRISTKLNFQPTLLTTFTLGLSGEFTKNRDFAAERTLFNTAKNGYRTDNTYRIFARYTQRFGQQSSEGSSIIKNAFYTIQADYSKQYVYTRDKDLGDAFFDYGYVGKFKSTRVPTLELKDYNGKTVYLQTDEQDTKMEITPGTINPILASYARQYKDLYGNPTNVSEYQANGGLLNGAAPRDIYELYNNVGRQVGFAREENDQIRLTAKFSADIKKHSIQAGFEYEQRVDRFYSPFPRSLWEIMNKLANKGRAIDLTTPSNTNPNTGDTVLFTYKVDPNLQSNFDKNLREALFNQGLLRDAKGNPDRNAYIDINALDPSVFSLNYLSADELIANTPSNSWNYSGYDYLGNKLKSKVNFNDFFTDSLNRPMGAFQPIYMAGYIQDKFTFKDLIVRIGLRVERFDANQKVLKDKYSLYEARTAGEVSGALNTKNGGLHPANIGSDYVVYASGQDGTGGAVEITGYRSGDKFYNAQGKLVSNVNELNAANGDVVPYFTDNVKFANGKPDFLNSAISSFTDYKPQVLVLPRVSFSFPISEEAVFFANYDVLAQRPNSGTNSRTNAIYSAPVDYFLIAQNKAQSLSNPNIKPETTIDYQIGYKQKLTQSSALSITASYRELRDQIQQITVANAYPIDYTTLDNRDFGTVKGLTFDYDLRRTGNATLRLSYTLQFANGTGSSTGSAANLLATGQGNVLVPTPLNYDQRHTFVATFDYRYGTGTDYNGPENLRSLLSGLGGNLIFRAGSGTPYSRQVEYVKLKTNPDNRFRTLIGTINGSQLPPNYNFDIRIDKDIALSKGSAKPDRVQSFLNLYLVVQNLFDIQNVVGVYSSTGNAGDDGYLTSVDGIKNIPLEVNPQSFIDLYKIRANNPNNYSSPRLLRLGAIINF